MGPLVPGLLLATAAATAAALLVSVSPAVAKTSVTTAGGVVTIHVQVDVYGGEGQTGPEGRPLDAYWEDVVNKSWGEAFNQLPYKNCYKFQLDLDIRLRSRDADDRDGWHRIHVTAPRSGDDWSGVGWGRVPETSRNPRTGDGTRSFENDQAGTIPVNAPPTVVAHEFGHVFGLGDDRQNGQAKPGRDGTLMVGGAEGVDPNQPLRIDQNLIDRIGDAIRKHLENQGKKLPKCETWDGTFRQRADVVGTGNPCPWTYEGPVQIVVAPDGSLTGSVNASFTEVMEDPALPCVGVPPGGGQATHPISGKRDRNRFSVSVSGPTGSVPLELSVAGKKAEGSTQVGGYIDTTMNLTCKKGCDEKVA